VSRHSSKYKKAHHKFSASDMGLLGVGVLFALVVLGIFLAHVWFAEYIIKGGKP